MSTVKFVIDEIKVLDTTNNFSDSAPFAEDEVYFAVLNYDGSGKTITENRIPRSGEFNLDSGESRKNIELAEVEVEDGEFNLLQVNVTEDEGLDPIGFLKAVKDATFGTLKIIEALEVEPGKDFDKVELLEKGVDQLAASAEGFYKALDAEEDSVGSFVVGLTNINGEITFKWQPTDDAKTVLFSPPESSFAYFESTGSGGRYVYIVSAEIVDSSIPDTTQGLQVVGRDGNDTLLGTKRNDTLIAGNAQDQLFGEAGDDYLNGGDGDDILRAGDGNDTLLGGNGQDQLLAMLATIS
jgi:Ca2+-binding RTX toxin-like protein